MINYQLLITTFQTIKANPEHYNNLYSHYGTTHDFAGFVECLAEGKPIDTHGSEFGCNTYEKAALALGISKHDAEVLFYGANDLEDIERCILELVKAGNLNAFSPGTFCTDNDSQVAIAKKDSTPAKKQPKKNRAIQKIKTNYRVNA